MRVGVERGGRKQRPLQIHLCATFVETWLLTPGQLTVPLFHAVFAPRFYIVPSTKLSSSLHGSNQERELAGSGRQAPWETVHGKGGTSSICR